MHNLELNQEAKCSKNHHSGPCLGLIRFGRFRRRGGGGGRGGGRGAQEGGGTTPLFFIIYKLVCSMPIYILPTLNMLSFTESKPIAI